MSYDETVVEFDYDDLATNYSHDICYYPCLSEWDIAILLSLTRFGVFPSRWRGSPDDPSWPTPVYLRDAQRYEDLSAAIADVERLRAKLIMATCGSEIKDGLLAIAAAMSSQQGCVVNCGCDGTGGGAGPVNGYIQGLDGNGGPMYGTQEGLAGNVETGIPDDWQGTAQEWWDRKCRLSNHLFDGLVHSVRNLATISIVNLVGGGVAIGTIAAMMGAGVVFPPILLPLLIAAVIAVGVSLAVLEQLADYMEDHREPLVCAFFNSKNVTEAYDAFGEYIDEAIAALAIPSAVSPHVRTIALLLASTDTLNTLFDIYIDVAYAGADCSGCEACGVDNIAIKNDGTYDWGEITSDTTNGGQRTIEVTATNSSGAWRVGLTTGFNNPDCCWKVVACTDGLSTSNNPGGGWYDCNGDSHAWTAGGSDEIRNDLLAAEGMRAFEIVYALAGPWTWTVTLEMVV